ncbi:DoxX family protein [Brevundimonas diminuta]|uniref:DoxX family protein n=1 Tax=Brevundimonas diminuta TaxID=293 RepID=UPI00320B181D
MSILFKRATVSGSILLTAAFWASGVSKLLDFGAAKAELRSRGLPSPALEAAIVVAIQLGGSGLVISGRAVWIDASLLTSFTVLALLVGHASWTAPKGRERTHHLNALLANLGLVGGLGLAVVSAESPTP